MLRLPKALWEQRARLAEWYIAEQDRLFILICRQDSMDGLLYDTVKAIPGTTAVLLSGTILERVDQLTGCKRKLLAYHRLSEDRLYLYPGEEYCFCCHHPRPLKLEPRPGKPLFVCERCLNSIIRQAKAEIL